MMKKTCIKKVRNFFPGWCIIERGDQPDELPFLISESTFHASTDKIPITTLEFFEESLKNKKDVEAVISMNGIYATVIELFVDLKESINIIEPATEQKRLKTECEAVL
ncbi:MAG: hypothetical protein NKF70_06795 [Methanobacterium sp. ERen5]|nr:MAG: hypothetical protein NKF70_06795 [Methanobacterium sp. ERen5]